MISIISEDPDSEWNRRLENAGLGTIYQSMEWGKIISSLGWKPIFLKFVDSSGKIVGQLLISEITRDVRKGTVGKLIHKMPILKKTICKWTYGPVIFDSSFSSEIYSVLGNFLRSKNCKVSGWQHPLCIDGIKTLEKSFELEPWGTFLIDLHHNKEELFNNIEKRSGRKNIERSVERGVTIEEITEKNLEEYGILQSDKSEGEEKVDLEHLSNWWRTFKPLGYSGFLARKDGVPMGGLLFSYFNKYIIEGGVARSEVDTKNMLYSQDLIKWKIIEWGVDNKMNYYDLAGFNPKPTSKKEEGIYRYKRKWGGKQYDYWILKG